MAGKKILLANDPELSNALEDSFFGRSGFAMMMAENEQHAFELIEEQDPGLAIFGMEPSGFRGDLCCRRVKDDPVLRATPIILIAGSSGEEDLARCREAGCDRILFRPIDSDELMTAACLLLKIVRRGAFRVDVALPLRCGKDMRKLRPGKILNLNLGGAFVVTDRLFPVGTLIRLDFSLTDPDHPVTCGGRVAWVNHPEWIKTKKLPAGMGLEFVDLAQEDAEALGGFLDRSRKKPA